MELWFVWIKVWRFNCVFDFRYVLQALEVEYGCKLCIGPCTTRGEVRLLTFIPGYVNVLVYFEFLSNFSSLFVPVSVFG